MAKISAPFTEVQIKKLNEWQSGFIEEKVSQFYIVKDGIRVYGYPVHPFTCGGHDGCERSKREDQGILIPCTIGFTCPCGKYKQYWCYDFMVK